MVEAPYIDQRLNRDVKCATRELAKDSGLGRENLYNALKVGAKPRFDTILRVCAALGVKLVPTGNHAA